ncbi:hypothetical protein [Streptomyces huiliensis]|uniref:hypothetical protein n=1 Tax=Streptomyces huiliensis TaxID=2876027 RepID=UPI001CC1198F|nr:hypothetical protein [Streptomyces huiliensis]MBZ4320321.1 hypothetical protein [Streptomyces huiliensis]
MSYEEKWAKFGIPRAAASDPAALRLASAGGEEGNGGTMGTGTGAAAGKLKVTASVLKTRAGKAEEVRGQFLKADDDVMRETGEVPGTLRGFTADEALKTFQERWLDQMAYVKGEFTETAKALSAAADGFRAEDRKHARSLGGNGNGNGGNGNGGGGNGTHGGNGTDGGEH